MSTEMQIIDSAVPDALSTNAILAQVRLIHSVMTEIMIKDTHYGVIPGTGTKPTLLKAGAEKLLLTFRLDPQYESTEHFMGEHLFVRSKCTLYHQTSGRRMGSGEGSCSTKEAKYAYRQGKRICPNCGKDAIIKGKEQYGGGWLCWKKKEGCGQQWPDGAQEIEGQSVDRVANEDVADQFNTVLKMANKRSLIAAVLNVTAASDIFNQDLDELMPVSSNQPIDAATPRGGKTSQEAGLANDVKSGCHGESISIEAAQALNAKTDAATLAHDLEHEYKAALECAIGPAANNVWNEMKNDARITQEMRDRLYPVYTASLKAGALKKGKND